MQAGTSLHCTRARAHIYVSVRSLSLPEVEAQCMRAESLKTQCTSLDCASTGIGTVVSLTSLYEPASTPWQCSALPNGNPGSAQALARQARARAGDIPAAHRARWRSLQAHTGTRERRGQCIADEVEMLVGRRVCGADFFAVHEPLCIPRLEGIYAYVRTCKGAH
jgi:hypothetical protein